MQPYAKVQVVRHVPELQHSSHGLWAIFGNKTFCFNIFRHALSFCRVFSQFGSPCQSSKTRRRGFSPGTAVFSPPSSVNGFSPSAKSKINAISTLSNLIAELSLRAKWHTACCSEEIVKSSKCTFQCDHYYILISSSIVQA